MNEYNLNIYRIVARIPKGKVATYVQIAAMSGNPQAARRVGYAMYHAPENQDLPCHRVVNSRGEMLSGNTFGGPAAQRERLVGEGVAFKANGRIDMTQSLWMFD